MNSYAHVGILLMCSDDRGISVALLHFVLPQYQQQDPPIQNRPLSICHLPLIPKPTSITSTHHRALTLLYLNRSWLQPPSPNLNRHQRRNPTRNTRIPPAPTPHPLHRPASFPFSILSISIPLHTLSAIVLRISIPTALLILIRRTNRSRFLILGNRSANGLMSFVLLPPFWS